MKQKILLVSYYYPPYSGIGAQRPYCLAQLLEEKGYEVIVLKADNQNYNSDVNYKTFVGYNDEKISTIDAKDSFFHRYFINYLKFRFVINKIVKLEKPSLLIFSGGPFYYFPVGAYIKKKYSIPYILDYRDNYIRPGVNVLAKGYKFIFDFFWDKRSVLSADYIVNVTTQLTEGHRAKYPYLNAKKFMTIYNGYNDNLITMSNVYNENKNLSFLEREKQIQTGKFLHIGIFGKFYYYNHKAVEILLKVIDRLNFRVKIWNIGKKEEDFIRLVKNSGKSDSFEFLGYKDYNEGLEILNSMDCFLLTIRDAPDLGTKVFDYIYLNKPIIAIVNAKSVGEIDRLLNKFENGFIIKNDIKKLEKLLNQISEMQTKILDNKIQNRTKYSRTSQLKKFVDTIKIVLEDSVVTK